MSSNHKIIEFVRQKDLVFVKELGQGACGTTVLLHDDVIDQHFVCKKYTPHSETERKELFDNFMREIKLLHAVNHQNVVRVFNYYVYPSSYAGYILMEFVNGTDIEEFLRTHPHRVDDVFRQAVAGFCHLEEHGILHRDIRPFNLLVSASGQLKVIDFGFGKRVETAEDFDKSVSLNWWCDLPQEFQARTYDFATEVYFVGKLFSGILSDNEVEGFTHEDLLAQMCQPNPSNRIRSFSQVQQQLLAAGFDDVLFSRDELGIYRGFSEALCGAVSRIERGAKYQSDREAVLRRLEDAHRDTMLEEYVSDNAALIRSFISGTFFFKKRHRIEVSTVKAFLSLFRRCSPKKQEIILGNVRARLNTLDRYDDEYDFVDIPF